MRNFLLFTPVSVILLSFPIFRPLVFRYCQVEVLKHGSIIEQGGYNDLVNQPDSALSSLIGGANPNEQL